MARGPARVPAPRLRRVNDCGHPEREHYGHGMCRMCWWLDKHPDAKARVQIDGLKYRDDGQPDYVLRPISGVEACPRCQGFVQIRRGVFDMPDEWRCLNCGWAAVTL